MKNIIWVFAIAVTFALTISSVQARNTKSFFPIDDALNHEEAPEKLDPAIKLHFSGQPPISFSEELGEVLRRTPTNSVFKRDKNSCAWALLGSLRELQAQAREKGADAVINIHSFMEKNPYESATEYECHAGATVARVTMRGTAVKR